MTKRKDIKYLLSLDYGIVTYKEKYGDEEYFVAEIPELKGCSAHGNTTEEAIEELKKAKEAWIKSALEDGEDVPLPEAYEEFSGKLILRINPKIHKLVAKAARKEGVSLNAWLNKAIQAGLCLEKRADETRVDIEKLKQDILAEVKTEVGGLRKLINVALVERQDIQANYPGIDWAHAGSTYAVKVGPNLQVWPSTLDVWVDNLLAPQSRTSVRSSQPIGTNDFQFTPAKKLEEAG